MNQYQDPRQIRSLIKQAYLINQVLDEYQFTSILDVGTGPGIIKRVLVKQGKLCHTVEQSTPWQEFSRFNPEIDFRMGYYQNCEWQLPSVEQRYDCVVLSRFFGLFHTPLDFESVTTMLHTLYSDNILIFHNPRAWRLNSHCAARSRKHETDLWPIYMLNKGEINA